MASKAVIVFLFLVSCFFSVSFADEVKVTIKSVTTIAKTDPNFICATLDWWPSDKCDYNQCPWGKAGLLNLDLGNKILFNAVKAFGPMRIRIGGSLQDQLTYNVGPAAGECPQFKKKDDGLFKFTNGCLEMKRWDQIMDFLNKTGAKLTFGLNALMGKTKNQDDKSSNPVYDGDWESLNARDFMVYNLKKEYDIDSYELGNELCGEGVSARIEAEQYGKDFLMFRKIVDELYPNASTRPIILGPAGFYEEKWFNKFLEVTGPDVVDGVTHHIYNLGSGDDADLINKIQDPFFLSQIAQTYKDVANSVKLFAPWSGAWVGEAGGAYNSGGKDVSHTFADGFWYLDQLGMTSTLDHKVYCRQALIGGNYALLNTTTFIPNPDYYGALLWHRLMGSKVLSTSHDGSAYLRAYSHCTKSGEDITILLINLSNSTTFEVSVLNDMNLNLFAEKKDYVPQQQREEYHLTPEGGDIQSDVLLLNGTPLKLTNDSDIPKMGPQLADPTTPIRVSPDSFVYATLKGFQAPACAK
ncbi:heparanase-like protein 2 [Cornus florida]|uniref:heparanase-like protein 2 n=1 Tax=Cornus florida TaxID=4283 RepID=UPI0028964F8A|nr:heparanase-like protein 2 [Cornus florida]